MKFAVLESLTISKNVAPFTGAWIEIGLLLNPIDGFYSSLPSRERGLKFVTKEQYESLNVSLPSRERGLKSINETDEAEE